MRIALLSLLLLLPLTAAAQIDASSATLDSQQELKELRARLDKIEGAPLKASLSAFNPAMGMAIDLAYEHQKDDQGAFQFRAAELNVEAPIDPFLKGWAVITGTNGNSPTTNGGTPTVDIEEAALQTTSLPYNLTVTGGRLFASMGRMIHWHDHELPVTDRPRSIDSFVGGESRADGLEVSYLFPTDTYINATAGMYDKLGADNTRQDPAGMRSLDQFTYLGRLNTYEDIGDDHSVELGVDSAWTPKRFVTSATNPAAQTRKNTWRTLSGVDFTYRYQPAQGGLYRGIVWGTEILQNDERRFDANNNPTCRVNAYSGYSYIQAKMGPRLRPGVLVDLAEGLDQARQLTKTYSGFLTYDVSEFQRLRVVYSRQMDNIPGSRQANIVALQWTGVMGHHVHGFRDR